MGKGDKFWRMRERRLALRKAEAAGKVADSLEVRKSIMDQRAAKRMGLSLSEYVRAALLEAS